MKEYKTLDEAAEAEYIIKKSRFIGTARPVSTSEEALDFIAEMKSKYWDATHNVYAYIIRNEGVSRYSDDGEPGGTAGVPSLDAMQKAGITDAAVVVTRYFGGIMLGAGGLVRAYSHTASIALQAARIITMAECAVCRCAVNYNFYGRLQPLLCERGAVITDTEFAGEVTVEFYIPKNEFLFLNKEIIEFSNGRFSAVEFQTEFKALKG